MPSHDSAWREKVSAKLKGHSVSAETRAKLSAGKVGNNYARGVVRTPAQREAVRSYRLGRRASPETRAKLAAIAAEQNSKRLRVSSLEVLVRVRLERLGIAFEAQVVLPGAPAFAFDFAIPARRILIEVDGCYWHGCVQCGYPGVPKTVRLDKGKTAWAKKNGWRLLRIKEHDLCRSR